MRKRVLIICVFLSIVVTATAQDIHSSTAVVLPLPGDNAYVVSNGTIRNISSARSVVLGPGTLFEEGSTVKVDIDNTTVLPPPPDNPSADLNRNWVMTTSYDEDGQVVGESKDFYDNNGNSIQSQTKNQTTGQVLATQTLYDAEGRAALTTLPAPTNNASFAYKEHFVQNSSGGDYGYLNFDGDPSNVSSRYTKVNNPDPISNTQIGTLGWYYSNNNTLEPLIPATGFPYSRIEYVNDGSGDQNRAASAGEGLNMGTGHELSIRSFPVISELDHYLSIRNKYCPATQIGSYPSEMSGEGIQQISVDANGNQTLSISDLSGKPLISGRADENGWFSVENNITLVPSANDFEVTINTNNKSTDEFYHTNSFSLISSYNVHITRDGVTVYDGSGNDYSFDNVADPQSSAGFTYVISSTQPFYYTKKAFVSPLQNPNVTLVDNAPARLKESPTTTAQYFYITKSQSINITGPYRLFDMRTGTEITSSFNNGSDLPAGYYKVMVKPGNDGNSAMANVQMSYINTFADVSYNFYNQLGQLILNVAPNGVKELILHPDNYAQGGTAPFSTANEYDLKGRLVASTSTDNGRTEFIYSTDGRIRFTQNAEQRTALFGGRFSYINYDPLGRSIESGEYTPQNSGDLQFSALKTNTGLQDATDDALTGGLRGDWVKMHYDLPDNSHGLSGYTQNEGAMRGLVSWTESENSKTWYNYDDQGRVSWLIKKQTGLEAKTVNYTYNAKGSVAVVDYQREHPTDRFLHYYDHDSDGRLVNVKTSRDNVNLIQHAKYYYYLHGPLKRIELGDQLQGIDYVYTPQGWLKSVNNASGDKAKDPNNDGLYNSFAPDAFGMQIEYFSHDYQRDGSNIGSINTGQTSYYNGNVNGIAWRSAKTQADAGSTPGIDDPAMYSYSYDAKYQMTQAEWGSPDLTNGTFNVASSFKEKNISYDANGNILGLQRYDKNGALHDNFNNYQYQPGTNKLVSVGSLSDPTGYASYTYDNVGQLKSLKHGDSNLYIKYNSKGLMTGVYDDAAMTHSLVSYTYDEMGDRISRTDAMNGTPVTTNYVYDVMGNILAIYNGASVSEMPVFGSDRLGTYYAEGNNYVYELKDNVGSVRAVINRNKKADGSVDVISYDDYYPYGAVAQSGGNGYRYQYQGEYAEKDAVTGWNNFDLRMYDGMIGRWLTMDPMGQYHSPYEGMGNNPVNSFDINGGCDPCNVPPPNAPSNPKTGTSYSDGKNTYIYSEDAHGWTKLYAPGISGGAYAYGPRSYFSDNGVTSSFGRVGANFGVNSGVYFANGDIDLTTLGADFTVQPFSFKDGFEESIDAYVFKGNASFSTGVNVKGFKITNKITGKVEFVSVDGKIALLTPMSNDKEKRGFNAEVSLGVHAVKAEIGGMLDISGYKINYVAGADVGDHIGLGFGAYYDSKQQAFIIKFEQNLGWDVGENLGVDVKIPWK
ncbi:RHS repeat-associated core domain-containing protein [Mucilaginibacter yixingensis]|nr:RHS repeat-associated core domain-containing protein [Mucilaginibacter yixingensis]